MSGAPPALPAELDARFEVVRLLGEGAFGKVMLARDRSSGAEVALKLLDAEAYESPSLAQRFEREARLSAEVRSPRIARLHGAGRADGAPYLIFEYVKGTDLERHLQERGGRLPVPAAMEIFRGILEGLAALEEVGVLHRDLKPANVLLRTDGSPVLTDLGLARGEDSETVTRTGQIMGTLAYMTPEQMLGEKASPDWDLYAAAMILVEMLTGATPFESGTVIEILDRKQKGMVAGLRAEGVDVSLPVDRLVRRMLAPRREERPTSAASVLDELREAELRSSGDAAMLKRTERDQEQTLESSEAIPVVEVPEPAPPPPPAPRRGGAALLGLLLLIGVGVGMSFTGGAPPPVPDRTLELERLSRELVALRDRVGSDEKIDRLVAYDARAARRDGTDKEEVVQLLVGARSSYRKLTENLGPLVLALLQGLDGRPLSIEAHSAAAELWLYQEILDRVFPTVATVDPLYHQEDPPGLEHLLGLGQRSVRASTLAASDEAVLRTVKSAADPSGIRIQSLDGQPYEDSYLEGTSSRATFELSRSVVNYTTNFDNVPTRLEWELSGGGPLLLHLVVFDWPEYTAMKLELIGREETTVLALQPPPPDGSQGTRSPFRLRVEPALVPEGLRKLRVTARGDQTLSDASVVVYLEYVLQLDPAKLSGPG